MRNTLYNLFIRDATLLCYRNCLDYVKEGSRLLDVGIGNGAMIQEFHGTIRSKGLSITGIDINRCYLDHCEGQIRRCGLEGHIRIHHVPVEAYEPPGPAWFDYVLFSMSFMLMNDQVQILERIKPWIRPDGRILFFQTMFRKRSPLIDLVKPRLKYLTTVEFGKAVYEDDFFGLLERERVRVEKDMVVDRKWFGGQYRFIVCRPEPKAASFTARHRGRRRPRQGASGTVLVAAAAPGGRCRGTKDDDIPGPSGRDPGGDR
jgi:alpha-N-acetylglucosaminidase